MEISIPLIEDINDVIVNFKYNQKDNIYKCKKSDRLIDLYNQFLNKNSKELNDLYLLCDGNKIEDYNITINHTIKSDKEKEKIFLVYDCNAINTVNSFPILSINDENNDDKKDEKTNDIQNDPIKIENVKPQNCCSAFINILKNIFSLTRKNFYGQKSTKSFFVIINVVLFFQFIIITLINNTAFRNEWHKIFIESEDSIKITAGINVGIVTILCGVLFIIMRNMIEVDSCLKKVFYFYIFIFIPIISIFCFLLISQYEKIYIELWIFMIHFVNLITLLSSILLDFGTFLGFFVFLIFNILFIFESPHIFTIDSDTLFSFHMNFTIIYIAYLAIVKYFACYSKMGCTFGIVITNYFMLFPIALVGFMIAFALILILIGYVLNNNKDDN